MSRRSALSERIELKKRQPRKIKEVAEIPIVDLSPGEATEKERYERMKPGFSNGYFTWLGRRKGSGPNHHLWVQCKCGHKEWMWNSGFIQKTKKACHKCRQRARKEKPRRDLWSRMEEMCGIACNFSYEEFCELTKGLDFTAYRSFGRWDHEKPVSPENLYLHPSGSKRIRGKNVKLFRFGQFCLHQEEWGIVFGITGERIRQLRSKGMTIDEMGVRYGMTDPDDIKQAILESVNGITLPN